MAGGQGVQQEQWKLWSNGRLKSCGNAGIHSCKCLAGGVSIYLARKRLQQFISMALSHAQGCAA